MLHTGNKNTKIWIPNLKKFGTMLYGLSLGSMLYYLWIPDIKISHWWLIFCTIINIFGMVFFTFGCMRGEKL